MAWQNFFATRLYTDIGASDTTITLENPPTPTSGRLVLEARNTSKREIISYTGVSGNDITGVTRGIGGTSATDHKKNSLVEMNVVAEDLSDALAVPNDIITRFDEVISDHVASGLVWTIDTGLIADMSVGVAYINGIRLSVSAVNNHTFTASKDTYVDLGDNGVLDYNEVANGAAAPALAANHIRIAKVVTSGAAITSVTQDNYDGLGNPIRPLEPIRQPKVLNPYVFSATQSANQTGITQGTWTTITLATENFDPNNNFASNTYTAPVAGFYLFCGEAQVNATTTGNGNGAGVRFLKNGSVALATDSWYDNNVSTDFDRRSISTVVQLAAGDTVVMQAMGYTISGTVLFTGSIFSGALISRL